MRPLLHARVVQEHRHGADRAERLEGQVRHLHDAILEEVRLQGAVLLEGAIAPDVHQVRLRDLGRVHPDAIADGRPEQSEPHRAEGRPAQVVDDEWIRQRLHDADA